MLARRNRMDVDDLPPEVGLAVLEAVDATDVRPRADVEHDYIRSVLRAVGGNRAQAAAKLGIGEATYTARSSGTGKRNHDLGESPAASGAPVGRMVV